MTSAFVAAVRKDNPGCRVLFIPVKPSIALGWKRYDTQTRANAAVRDECAKGTLATSTSYPSCSPTMGRPTPCSSSGWVTPESEGYEIWTAEVNKALAK